MHRKFSDTLMVDLPTYIDDTPEDSQSTCEAVSPEGMFCTLPEHGPEVTHKGGIGHDNSDSAHTFRYASEWDDDRSTDFAVGLERLLKDRREVLDRLKAEE